MKNSITSFKDNKNIFFKSILYYMHLSNPLNDLFGEKNKMIPGNNKKIVKKKIY